MATRRVKAEFQVVILAGGIDNRLYPLTEGLAKPLLPVANRPILAYQLDLLDKAGFSEVIIVTSDDHRGEISNFIRGYNPKVEVDICSTDAFHRGTAEALRSIRDKLKTDFMVMAGDLITEGFIHYLADIHRTKDAALTMLLKQEPREDAVDKSSKVKKTSRIKKDEDLVDFIGLADENRVVFMSPAVFLEDGLQLPKALLKRVKHITMHTDLIDAHFFIFSHWVLDILESRKNITSIQADLVPLLVRRQFKGSEEILERLKRSQHTEMNMSSSSGSETFEDVVRCYAYVIPPEGGYCARANTLAAYASINREIIAKPVSVHTPWTPIKGLDKVHKDSLIAEGFTAGDKVSLKGCVIGRDCSIGNKTKLNNCIVMDHVRIGENCVLQNSIICGHVAIEDNVNLNDCQVAAQVRISAGSKLRNDSIAGNT